MRLLLSAAVAALLSSTTSVAAPADQLKTLLDDHWAWSMKNSPVYATMLGIRTYDRELGDPSLAAEDRRAAEAQALIDRLDEIDTKALTPIDRTNAAILRRQLAEQVEGNKFGQRAVTFTTYSSWFQNFAGLGEDLPFQTKADYESYLARLAAYPAYNDAQIEVTRRGLKDGYAQPCEPLKGFEKTIGGVVVDDVTASRLYLPFKRKPSTISAADWAALDKRARDLIAKSVNPAFAQTLDFYTKEYAPKCRNVAGIGSTPGGADYYAFRVRAETTTDLAPDAIHKLGLSEVARITAEMEAVAKKAGYADRKSYVEHLRTDPRYYPKTPAELMREAAYLAKLIDGWMPKLFVNLPRLPYTVREIPAEIAEGTTTAYYGSGKLASATPGVYWVNTSKLDQRPFYELPSLTIHEAVPGHHHQISLAQELDLPMFRRFGFSSTAFVEGWALYTEGLGYDMGLYDTPAKEMGRLSYEMWRACRLVVDTGIHSKGWTREQAIQFMLDNTALSRGNIEAEVNRYITWPGQALAYKLGELTIRRLRTKAETALGEKFDLRRFHDAVLEQGSVPLDVLESHIDEWIVAQKKA
ncbi:DUF885 domain-containing protein [Sphingoaurantiacus capsulatus]|uniref:DUF885 domain-containing protein n=1 Tax=Sphingoaurantiacus capsulatus TaxID=1771310 RepID=A0ABV7XCN8_9SPHN